MMPQTAVSSHFNEIAKGYKNSFYNRLFNLIKRGGILWKIGLFFKNMGRITVELLMDNPAKIP